MSTKLEQAIADAVRVIDSLQREKDWRLREMTDPAATPIQRAFASGRIAVLDQHVAEARADLTAARALQFSLAFSEPRKMLKRLMPPLRPAARKRA